MQDLYITAANLDGDQAAALIYLTKELRICVEALRMPRQTPAGACDPIVGERAVSRSRAVALLESVEATLAQHPLNQERCAFFDNLRKNDFLVLKNIVLGYMEKHPKGFVAPDVPLPPRQRFFESVTDGYWQLRDALHSFYLRDLILYPMMRSEDIQQELATIEFARISPNDASLFRPGLSARDKLAGESLFHFGGFLEKSWRGNDLVWGRLDAAEIIVRKLLPREKWDTDGERIVRAIQAKIIDEMVLREMTIFESPSGQLNKNLISRQSVKDISANDRIRWFLKSSVTLGKIIRKSAAESRAAPYLGKVITGFSWALNSFMGVAIVLTIFCKYVATSWAKLSLVLAIIALMFGGWLLWHNSCEYLVTHPVKEWEPWKSWDLEDVPGRADTREAAERGCGQSV